MLGIIALLAACGDTKQMNEDLKAAFELHKEAIEIRKMAKDKMARLKANKDSLFIATHTEDLNSITRSLETWDEQLVEVPGFEHDPNHSDHDHDHDHDHDNGQELTPKQHLEVQRHLLDEVKAMAEKINSIKE
ncbi:MAG: hypothetical protein AAFX53_17250 [Bacteroidota bacterium]